MFIVLSNGFIAIIPVLIWNVLLTKRLPKEFGPDFFDLGIPKVILFSENALRILVFLLPLFTRLNIKSNTGRLGLIIYIIGIIIYFGSWLLLIRFPEMKFRESIFIFTAPAYTPLIWLVGLCLMMESYILNFSFIFGYYAPLCCLFIGVHLTHTILVFRKTDKEPPCTQ